MDQQAQTNKVKAGVSTALAFASLVMMGYGFSQSYTYDPLASSPGAPQVSVMANVVGLGVYIDLIVMLLGTSNAQVMATFKFRAFIYACLIFFGFLSMVFYVAPPYQLETVGALGALVWCIQAGIGLQHLMAVKRASSKATQSLTNADAEKGSPATQEEHTIKGHCCGVGCCTKSGCGMCCRWTLWVFAMLFFVQAAMILSDNMLYLQQGAGTGGALITMVPVTGGGLYTEGNTRYMSWFCRGTKQSPTDSTVLLEAGGGTGMASMMTLLDELVDNHGVRVCAYDRSGYGFSQRGVPYSDLDVGSKDCFEALEYLGETGPYVVAGHSAGGTVSRNFQSHYPQNVSGLVMMDAYCNVGDCNIEKAWNDALNNTFATNDMYAFRLSATDAMRMFSPFLLIRAFISKGGFEGSNHGGNGAWNSQYMDFRPPLNDSSTDALYEHLWYTSEVTGNIPHLISTAGQTATCEQKDAWNCDDHLARNNATAAEIEKYMATSTNSLHVDCVECGHGFVWEEAPLVATHVMAVVESARNGGAPLVAPASS